MKSFFFALAISMTGLSVSANVKDLKHHKHVPGELIIKLRKSANSLAFLQNARSFGIREIIDLKVSFGNLYKVKVDQRSLEASLVNLNSLSEIEYAEPNFIYTTHEITDFEALLSKSVPSDPNFSQLWGIHNTGDNDPNEMEGGVVGADVNALAAWDITKGSKNVKIAVIDTGVDYNHPDLAPNMWINTAEANGEEGVDDDGNGFIDDIHGYDFANDDSDPIDGHGHGTHCSGTIAAVHNNGEGVAGVMANASIVAIKFLSDSGSGTTANAIRAIDYATLLNVDIMSNSWGGGGYSQALADSITRAEESGIYFVAAAGNSSSNNDGTAHYPSNYENDNVVSVAAHNIQDQLASFSCYGAETVDIAAPGRNILSTVKSGGYSVYSGTSMATPHVTGVLGLLVANEGRISVDEMKDRLLWTSVPVSSYRRKSVSWGRVDAFNILSDIRPERPEMPNEDDWQGYQLDSVFESPHPYDINQTQEVTFNVENARFIRVVVEQIDLERNYDYLHIIEGAAGGPIVSSLTGAGTNVKSDYVMGDTVTIRFNSDYSVTDWGFKVSALEVIY